MYDLPYDATADPAREATAPDPPVGANGFLLAPRPHAGPARTRGSRWEGDSVTYHRWGRVLASVAVVLPSIWMWFTMNAGGLVFFLAYVVLLMPMALRHIWRRTTPTVLPLRSSPPRSH